MSFLDRLTNALSPGARDAESARHEREALLSALVEHTPVALILLSDAGVIVFTNAVARELFFEGAAVEGQNFLGMLARASEPLRRALLSENDHIFSFDDGGGYETYHLARRQLTLGNEPHTLLAVRHMTAEISRQENATLKKIIRIMQHELSNSLAPTTSLLRTGREILEAGRPELYPKLGAVFTTVADRLAHLDVFLGGLARFGKLPPPRPRAVEFAELVSNLRALWPSVRFGAPPAGAGWFDPAQIEQVVINLLKNAHEAGGDPGAIAVELETAKDGGVTVSVLDRGPGMSDEVLANAMLPSFTTKPTGSGMGLALCREIVEAHAGRMRVARREGGGMVVSFWLPPREVPAGRQTVTRAKLTLKRG